MRRNLINYLKDFLLIKKKNKLLYEVLKTQSENIKKYPNLYVPVFDYISTCLMIYGRYEEEELQCIKKNLQKLKKETIIDIGAHIGNHSIFFSNYAKNVISFEPNPFTYKLLKLNTENYKNIKTFNLGISNKNSKVRMNFVKMNTGTNQIVKSKIKLLSKTNSFSKLITLNKLKFIKNMKVSLVKIDIEKHEIFALKGMDRILIKNKPILILEYNSNDSSNKKTITYLRSLGYKKIYILTKKSWITPAYLPNPIKKILKFIEIILYGAPNYKYNLKESNYLPENLTSHFFLMSVKKII